LTGSLRVVTRDGRIALANNDIKVSELDSSKLANVLWINPGDETSKETRMRKIEKWRNKRRSD
jgi:hypothetical protein